MSTRRRAVRIRRILAKAARFRALRKVQGGNAHWHRARFYFCAPEAWAVTVRNDRERWPT